MQLPLPIYTLPAVLLRLVHAAPTSQRLYVDGGLTILTQNLLDGAQNDGSAAILSSQPSSYFEAEATCRLLGEALWDPREQKFEAGLNTSLAYQVFQGLAREDELFWVAGQRVNSTNGTACNAISPKGEVTNVDCQEQSLQALCTQSAPVSNSSSSDTATRWQINHLVDQVQLTGYRDLHTWKFRGVRYAKTPRRFTYSEIRSFDTPSRVSALEAGADCVQPVGEVKSGSSEDCLFLNIWTPTLSPLGVIANNSQLKPVMVYFYGGGLQTGSGKNPNTDGTNLASRGDVVVVSVNYRVGNVGFLAFNDSVHNGNYGISDMVTALEWVNKYIGYLGGDAQRITIFGESAGAQATHLLLASPKAKGLFQRAIMQSDPTGYPDHDQFTWSQYASVEDAYKGSTTKVLNETGCLDATDQIACLSQISGFDLVNLTTNANGVVADGTYLVDHQLDLTKPGLAVDVDVITGINRDEAGVLIDDGDYPENGTTFEDYFNAHVAHHFGLSSAFAKDIRKDAFSLSDAMTPAQILNASLRITTDGVFTCFDLAKAYSAAKHGAFRSTYAFAFNRTYSPSGYTRPWCDPPATAERPHGDPDAEYFKCHAGEQLVVFGNAARAGQPDRDGLDEPFARLVVDYWAGFARTGNPNPDVAYLRARGRAETLAQIEETGPWEQVDASRPTLRLLQWNGGQVPFMEASECEALGIPLDVLEKSKDMLVLHLVRTCLDTICHGRHDCVGYPDDPFYQVHWVKPYNLALDIVPAAVTRPRTAEEVAGIVKCAAANHYKVQAKSGGHSYANYGLGGADGAVAVDMVNFQGFAMDNSTWQATVGSGTLLSDLASRLHDAGGRAIAQGVPPGIGVGGHATVGGFGPMGRMWGTCLDHVVEVEVVTADGSIQRANETHNRDLFWAIRGAASGFGIVTDFVFRTHPDPGPAVQYTYTISFGSASAMATAFRDWQRLILDPGLDRRFGTTFILQPLGILITGTFYGSQREFEASGILDGFPKGGTLGFTVDGWLGSLINDAQNMGYFLSDIPISFYCKSLGFRTKDALPDDRIEDLFTWIGNVDKGALFWFLLLDASGGAINDLPANATAYPHRDKFMFYQAYTIGVPVTKTMRDFLTGMHDRFLAVRTQQNDTGTYAGYVDPALKDAQRQYWGTNLPMLEALKRRWDPTDVFHNPQSVRPAPVLKRRWLHWIQRVYAVGRSWERRLNPA
ncbi:hypothetical protein VTK73DRAFT_7278 [Phialemonium thermophilum]|uniref:FAD-binding PCMH-type domain-containing protein n=1 Tax=Phialemonium thermophilum TaxID=223376 RepID=A0ABR3WFK6_9PEZI